MWVAGDSIGGNSPDSSTGVTKAVRKHGLCSVEVVVSVDLVSLLLILYFNHVGIEKACLGVLPMHEYLSECP